MKLRFENIYNLELKHRSNGCEILHILICF